MHSKPCSDLFRVKFCQIDTKLQFFGDYQKSLCKRVRWGIETIMVYDYGSYWTKLNNTYPSLVLWGFYECQKYIYLSIFDKLMMNIGLN